MGHVEELSRSSSSSSNQEQLLLQIETYKKLLERSHDTMYENISKIVCTTLKHLSKKIQGRLNSVHDNNALMVRVMRMSQRDMMLTIPTLNKWAPRAKRLKLMLVGAGQHEDKYPQMLPVYEFVCELSEKNFQGYVAPLEQKIIDLIAQINHTDLLPLPEIQVNNYELKSFHVWKKELNEVIDAQVNEIFKEVDINVFTNTLERLTFLISFLEDFHKESNAVVTKYSPYKKALDKIIDFDWPFEEEYEEWGRVYAGKFGL